jgi:L-lactate dehydrogenase (cytochrome)
MPLINLSGYRAAARRALPRAIFDYVDGGAEDEVTLRANRASFAALRLIPRIQEDNRALDLRTGICGQEMALPIMLSPTGNSGLIHYQGDLAGARAAAKRELIMVVSGASNYTVEEIAEANPGAWYQLYPWVSRDFYGALIRRVAAAGYQGLVVTVDVPGPPKRERDIANGFTPPRLTRRNAWDIATHPRWTADVVLHRRVVLRAFLADDNLPGISSFIREAKRTAGEVTRTAVRATWDEIAWIREQWSGPLGVKGILAPEDARRAVDLGADVIYVSNHGGRQLDSAPAGIEVLPAIADAVGDDAAVVLDGGIRRGTDIVKALCLGARAVSIGRPWLYGLAASGPAGVEEVIDLLQRELSIALNLLGQPSVRGLNRSYLMPAGVEFDPSARQVQSRKVMA